MKEDTELKETTSRREITKAAVIAAVAAPIAAVLASCTNQPTPGGEATPSASPTPTKRPREGGDSPIIVGGGGSVSIDFDYDQTYLVDNPANPTMYRGAVTIQRVIFMNRKGELTNNLTFDGADSHIAFDIRDTGNVNKPVRIDSTGGQTTITFNKDDYPRDGHRFFHQQRKLKTITVNGVSQGLDDKGTIFFL